MTLHIVFTRKLPSKRLPSPYLTLTLLALLHILTLCTKHFPTNEELAPVSTTAATSSLAKCNLTVKREVC